MDNLPPLRALQIFNIVGRCSGIAEAARRLGISAGAVSQPMKLAEALCWHSTPWFAPTWKRGT